MRSVAKGLILGSLVGSAVGMIVSQTARGGLSPGTKRMIHKVEKMIRTIL